MNDWPISSENSFIHIMSKSIQGNQDSSGNQENVIQRQRPDMENKQTQQRL